MTSIQGPMAQWGYHVPSALLAALMCLVVCRFAVEVVTAGRSGLVGRVLRGLTDVAVRPVRAITPALAPLWLVMLLALAWLMALRMLWFVSSVALGMRPTLGG